MMQNNAVMHRRGKWGSSCPPGDILAPPGRLLPPSHFYSGP